MEKVYLFSLAQRVSINNITGYMDFIGCDIIDIVDNENNSQIINKAGIKEIYSDEMASAHCAHCINSKQLSKY